MDLYTTYMDTYFGDGYPLLAVQREFKDDFEFTLQSIYNWNSENSAFTIRVYEIGKSHEIQYSLKFSTENIEKIKSEFGREVYLNFLKRLYTSKMYVKLKDKILSVCDLFKDLSDTEKLFLEL